MIGARVRQVRELFGWNQTQLAAKAGLDQPTISKIENGAAQASLDFDDRLLRIASCTGFSTDWFERPPAEEFSDGTIRFRKKAAARKRDDRMAIRRLELAFEIVALLERDESIRLPPVTIPFLGPSESDDQIEELAVVARQALDLPSNGPIRNVTRSLERAGAIVIGIPQEIGETDRVNNHHGVSAWPDLGLRPVIGFSTEDPGDRQRHTLAHELGHLCLHRGLHDDHKGAEREASLFAGGFLMSRTDAVDTFSSITVTLKNLVPVKREWGISIAALIMRARQVGMIDEDRFESLFRQLSSRGWRREEPVVVRREEPALISQLLRHRFGEAIDWRTAHAVSGPSPIVLRQLAFVGDRDQQRSEGDYGDVVRLRPA
jgi:Zn-dependent peptidase ImmA (M78 family)/DNA-binding XRE family transcriptional regulator